jgi:hypothetical protein
MSNALDELHKFKIGGTIAWTSVSTEKLLSYAMQGNATETPINDTATYNGFSNGKAFLKSRYENADAKKTGIIILVASCTKSAMTESAIARATVDLTEVSLSITYSCNLESEHSPFSASSNLSNP